MSGVNFLGMYSGIDMEVIDQMIEAERAKGSRFTVKKNRIQSQQSAWKDINSGLDAFLKKANSLGDAKTFRSRTVSSNVKDSSVLKVSANEKVLTGQYRVQVGQLAESARLTGTKIDIGDNLNLEGTFEITAGGESFDIEVGKNDTLEDIVGKINSQIDGVEAKLVDGKIELSTDLEGDFEVGGDLAKDLGLEGDKVVTEDGKITGNKVTVKQSLGLSGTFGINLGDKTLDIEIKESDTLRDIINNINRKAEDKNIGVQATVIENRIVLNATDLGEQELSVSGELAENLGLTGEQVQVATGQNAKFTVNGIEIERASNTISDAVDGLTFKLTSAHKENEFEMITVDTDTEKISGSVKEFVDEYNKLMSQIKKQMDVGDPSAEDNQAGALAGDGTLMRLQTSLRSLLTSALTDNASGNITRAEDIGITVDRDGVASFDEAQFNEMFREDPTNVARFFYNQEMVDVAVEGGEEGETTTKLEKRGMSELFNNFISTYVEKSTGIIASKNASFDTLLKDIDGQIEIFNERVDKKRERYIAQFTAVDLALMQAESQMDYMFSQMEGW